MPPWDMTLPEQISSFRIQVVEWGEALSYTSLSLWSARMR
jgi:hypothetical protein